MALMPSPTEATWRGAPVRRAVVRADKRTLAKYRAGRAEGVPGAVAAVVVDDQGRFLLYKPAATSGWRDHAAVLPGGWVEPGESFEDAARREVKEEVGLDVVVERPLLAVQQSFDVGGWPVLDEGETGIFPVVFFLCRARNPSATPAFNAREVEAIGWWDVPPAGTFDREHLLAILEDPDWHARRA